MSRTKVSAAHAGLSQPPDPSKADTLKLKDPRNLSQSNNLWTAQNHTETKVAMEV